MAFTVHGSMGGVPVIVRWDAGELDGDQQAVAAVRALVDGRESIGRTATGPFVRASLGLAERALLTICSALDPAPILTGDLPDPVDLAPLPDGAIP